METLKGRTQIIRSRSTVADPPSKQHMAPSPLLRPASQNFRPSPIPCAAQPKIVKPVATRLIIPSSPSPSPSISSINSTISDDSPNPLFSTSPTLSERLEDWPFDEEEDVKFPEDPRLVRLVLELHDVQRFDWMMIAEPLHRLWGIETSSAAVLDILQRNGRIQKTVWWD